MSFLKHALSALPAVATSPWAFLAYAIVITAWMVVALHVRRAKTLLKYIEKLPERERAQALRDSYGSPELAKGLSPEQWIQHRIHTFLFVGFLSTLASATLLISLLVISVITDRSAASPDRLPDLSVTISSSEHVHFVLYPAGASKLPSRTPAHSMLNKHPGAFSVAYTTHDPTLPDIPDTRFREVVLPEGEAVFDFKVTNYGDQVSVVDSVSLELQDVVPLPASRAGMFLPAFDPFKDEAILRSDTSVYHLFHDTQFNYKQGDSDTLRLSVRVADAEDPGIFVFRLRIDHHSKSNRYVSYSESVYIAKYFAGFTNRNVYAKFHQDDPPQSSATPALRYVDGVAFLQRADHFTTGQFLAVLASAVANPTCGSHKIAAERYIVDNLPAAVLDSSRAPVQRYGFTIDGRPAPNTVLDEADFHVYRFDSQEQYTAKELLPHGESVELTFYEKRSTELYDCVILAVIDIVLDGNSAAINSVTDAAIELSRSANADIAAHIDLLPLLAILNNSSSLSRVSDYLNHDNYLVVGVACDMLAQYRYAPASARLLKLATSTGEYLKRRSTRALIMSGDEEAADALLQILRSPNLPEDERERYAAALVEMVPRKVEQILRRSGDEDSWNTLREAASK